MKAYRLVSIDSVLEPKFMCPSQSRNLRVWSRERLIVRAKENRQLMFKNPKLTDTFRGRVFIGKIWGKGCEVWNFPLTGWW